LILSLSLRRTRRHEDGIAYRCPGSGRLSHLHIAR